ncbi:MAG TPA: sigma-70 family RNA polymerase sigma factor [Tepidisphaeraceae bacterium]|jgi:RNA polymerase sigma factor (sigma-70 family)
MDQDQLLTEYTRTRSHEAFGRIVERYVDLVFSTARRQVRGDSHRAEDVTQAVFMLLAKKAGVVPRDRPLSAWLHRATCYIASNARRADESRRKHEQRALEMNGHSQTTDPSDDTREWEAISPLLDEGLSKLRAEDRDAILLKFFDRKTHRQIGEALGVSEEAAAKRVLRAVERLRDFFRRRGVTTATSAAIGASLAARAIEAAPSGLASTISAGTGAAAGTTAGASLLKGVILVTATEKLKVTALVCIALLLAGGGSVVVIKALRADTTPQAQTPAATAGQPANISWDASPASAPATLPAPQSGVARFSNGSQVQILGIADGHDQNTKTWWDADGLPVPPVGFPYPAMISAGTDATRREYQFIIRQSGAPDGSSLSVGFEKSQGSASTSQRFPDGSEVHKFAVALPRDLGSVGIRLGMAVGPYEEYVLWQKGDAAQPATKPAYAPLSFFGMTDDKGEAVIRMTRPGVAGRARRRHPHRRETCPLHSFRRLDRRHVNALQVPQGPDRAGHLRLPPL